MIYIRSDHHRRAGGSRRRGRAGGVRDGRATTTGSLSDEEERGEIAAAATRRTDGRPRGALAPTVAPWHRGGMPRCEGRRAISTRHTASSSRREPMASSRREHSPPPPVLSLAGLALEKGGSNHDVRVARPTETDPSEKRPARSTQRNRQKTIAGEKRHLAVENRWSSRRNV